MSKEIIIENINSTVALGVALKRFRKNKGMSQDQLAKLLNMRQATVSGIENGRGTLESFFKIVQLLKINLALSNLSSIREKSRNSKVGKMLNLLNDK